MANPSDRTGIRINLTLPPETVRAVDRMCDASGVGRATFIRELLVGMQPQIHGFAEAVELAKQNNLDAFSKMASTLRAVNDESEQLQLDIKRNHRAAMRKRNK
jgi:hypothetical protein